MYVSFVSSCLLFFISQDHRNLSQLPNFAFSVPLAMFLQEENKESGDTKEADEKVVQENCCMQGYFQPIHHNC